MKKGVDALCLATVFITLEPPTPSQPMFTVMVNRALGLGSVFWGNHKHKLVIVPPIRFHNPVR